MMQDMEVNEKVLRLCGMWCVICVAICMTSCSATRMGPVVDCAPRPPGVDIAVEKRPSGLLVKATLCNTTGEPIYVCESPSPHFPNFRATGPYVYYGGAETLVLYWAMIRWPEYPYVIDESRAMLGATVRRVEPGARFTLSHPLDAIVREHNACMLRLCDLPQGEKDLPIRRVMVVIGYWERAEFVTRLNSVADLAQLPLATYRESVARAIEAQQVGFNRLMTIGDLQLLVIAGPTALPSPIMFEAEPTANLPGTQSGDPNKID